MSNFLENQTWMYNRQRPGGGVTDEFQAGVDEFLKYAIAHPDDMSNNNLVCPCSKCCNQFFKSRGIVRKHLYYNGFIPCYYVWLFHGEKDDPNIYSVDPGSSSNTNTFANNINITDLFTDLADGAVDHVNSNLVCSVESEVPNVGAKSFYRMLEAANEQLYDGDSVTLSLLAIAELIQIKANRNVTIDTYNPFVDVFKTLMSKKNKLPSTYREAELLFKKLGLSIIKIDACPNDCMLYYAENSNLEECPTYFESRYTDASSSTGSSDPQKILRYMPLAPHLQCLFMSCKTAGHMTWHHQSPREEGVMAKHGKLLIILFRISQQNPKKRRRVAEKKRLRLEDEREHRMIGEMKNILAVTLSGSTGSQPPPPSHEDDSG